MVRELRNTTGNIKILLGGHRGSGKTTELIKLSESLRDKFETVRFSVWSVTGRYNLRYEDLMLVLNTQIIAYCLQHKLIPRAVHDRLEGVWEKMADLWRTMVAGLSFRERGATYETRASLQTLIGEIELGASRSPMTREELHKQIDMRMPELTDYLNQAIALANQRLAPRRLLVIVEDLDKIDVESARHIFLLHARTITGLEVPTIFTFPLALRYSVDLQQVQLEFQRHHFLRNPAVHERDGSQRPEGIEFLKAIIDRRINRRLITDEAVAQIVFASGGMLIDLIQLVNTAIQYALDRDEQTGQILPDDVQNAMRELRNDRAANLTRGDWQTLHARHADRTLTADPENVAVLYKNALLEYENGVAWCDIHPLLLPLLPHYAEAEDTTVDAGG